MCVYVREEDDDVDSVMRCRLTNDNDDPSRTMERKQKHYGAVISSELVRTPDPTDGMVIVVVACGSFGGKVCAFGRASASSSLLPRSPGPVELR